MRRYFLTIVWLLTAMTMMAVPAKPGIWKTLKLADGTEVRARLAGDEHVHFWVSENGGRYAEASDGVFEPVSSATLARRAANRRAVPKAASRLLSPKKVAIGERTHYLGQKKGIVILAQFTNQSFKTGNNQARYNRILNEEGYNEGSFRGSVADYFKAQSAGQFELTFDVVGPVTLPKAYSYYGGNDSDGNDLHPEEMIIEACQMVDSLVDFHDYDWDGDGEVDQVFVLYAGKGEADGGSANTIWPHMWTLDEAEVSLTLDSVKINTYACSNEVNASNSIEGIGTFCHEFSHCMGFPDFYDTAYAGWFGMQNFDLMCSGSYNGNGFCPPNYTAHEKMMCGWQEPIVLADNDTIVENLKSMTDHGETFIIYNDGHPDEYFMLENRQKTGWDTSYPARGLMITHVDFDSQIWAYNCPNTEITRSSVEYRQYGYPLNDHQRMTIVHADNDDDSSYNYGGYGYWRTTTSTDLYPYQQNDSLTATSKPAPALYNKNLEGKKTVDWGILHIKQNSDGTMGFVYRAAPEVSADTTAVDTTVVNPPVGDYLFYESFDKCTGTGGNDDQWMGSVANAAFVADNADWDALAGKAFGGKGCAKFGTTSVVGIVTTPEIPVDGEAILTFKAGAWNANVDGITLLLESEEAIIEPSSFEIVKGSWTDCTATVKGTGNVKITFTPVKRFFLDEVKVVEADVTAIQSVKNAVRQDRIYTLDGRYMGTDKAILKPGLYIMNGRKFVK